MRFASKFAQAWPYRLRRGGGLEKYLCMGVPAWAEWSVWSEDCELVVWFMLCTACVRMAMFSC